MRTPDAAEGTRLRSSTLLHASRRDVRPSIPARGTRARCRRPHSRAPARARDAFRRTAGGAAGGRDRRARTAQRRQLGALDVDLDHASARCRARRRTHRSTAPAPPRRSARSASSPCGHPADAGRLAEHETQALLAAVADRGGTGVTRSPRWLMATCRRSPSKRRRIGLEGEHLPARPAHCPKSTCRRRRSSPLRGSCRPASPRRETLGTRRDST